MNDYCVERIRERDIEGVLGLLERNDLELEATAEYTAVLRHKDVVVGTCSYEKNIIKSFAIQPCYQGVGASAQLLTHVVNRIFDKGEYTAMAFTFSKNRMIFEGMQFRCIYDTGVVALLLTGIDSLDSYLKEQQALLGKPSDSRSAIVMNGNPFTKGHQHLIEVAAKESEEVVVFVVEEDLSIFPFQARLKLIREGTKHLGNVKVVHSGNFMVSKTTFPNYFVRDASDKARLSAELDAGLFAEIIAKPLNINRRYVGTEPSCDMTNMYNQILQETFISRNLELRIIERRQDEGRVVSATVVREMLASDQWEEIKQIVPETTYEFLKSGEAKKLIENLKREVRSH